MPVMQLFSMIPGASIATQQQQQQQQMQGRGMYCSVPIAIHASIELNSCRSVESYIIHVAPVLPYPLSLKL